MKVRPSWLIAGPANLMSGIYLENSFWERNRECKFIFGGGARNIMGLVLWDLWGGGEAQWFRGEASPPPPPVDRTLPLNVRTILISVIDQAYVPTGDAMIKREYLTGSLKGRLPFLITATTSYGVRIILWENGHILYLDVKGVMVSFLVQRYIDNHLIK